MFKLSLWSFGVFLDFDDLVSTLDLNIHGSFIPFRYSFSWQVAKQSVKASEPIVHTFNTHVHVVLFLVCSQNDRVKSFYTSMLNRTLQVMLPTLWTVTWVYPMPNPQ